VQNAWRISRFFAVASNHISPMKRLAAISMGIMTNRGRINGVVEGKMIGYTISWIRVPACRAPY
jgi:hypothetical protein